MSTNHEYVRSSIQLPHLGHDRRLMVAMALAVCAGAVMPVTIATTHSMWLILAIPFLIMGAGWAIAAWQKAEIIDRAITEERLRRLSVHDELTGCHNRTGAQLLGDQLLHTVRRRGDAIHSFMIDISHLTRNRADLHDSEADEVMVAVAEAIRASTRGTDVVARWDRRRFLVIGPGSGIHPGELERRVRAYLSDAPPVPLDVWPCRVTVGHASLAPWDSGDLSTLTDRAAQDLDLRRSMRAPSAPEAFFTKTQEKKS